MTAKLSDPQIVALWFIIGEPQPESIHPKDREPEKWIRLERKNLLEALQRKGLVCHVYRDYPHLWCAELTDAGIAERTRLRAEGMPPP